MRPLLYLVRGQQSSLCCPCSCHLLCLLSGHFCMSFFNIQEWKLQESWKYYVFCNYRAAIIYWKSKTKAAFGFRGRMVGYGPEVKYLNLSVSFKISSDLFQNVFLHHLLVKIVFILKTPQLAECCLSPSGDEVRGKHPKRWGSFGMDME